MGTTPPVTNRFIFLGTLLVLSCGGLHLNSSSGTLRTVEFDVFDRKVVFDLFEPDRRVGRALLADRERHLDATHFLIVVVMQRSASKIFLNQPDLPRDEYGGHAGRTFRHALRGCVGR